jgi:HlyD family secretion protein
MRRKPPKKALIPVAVLVIVAGAYGIVRLTRVRHDRGAISVYGTVEATVVEVSFRLPGRVVERLVSEGDRVRKGQVVARLDDTELREQAALQDAQVEAARANAERATADYESQRTLLGKEVGSRREYRLALAAHEGARAQLRAAEQSLRIARTRLDDAVLVSPCDGSVLSENVEAGEYAAPGTPVVTVGNLEDVWIRAYIDEPDLGRVRLGQSVRVRTDSHPDKTYEGRVTHIAPQAEFTPKNVQTKRERVTLVYRVKISVPNPDEELKPGMPVDAEILAEGPEK